MKGVVVCQEGTEEAALQEVLSLLPKSNPVAGKKIVQFSVEDRQQLVRLTYTSQVAMRVMELVEQTQAEDVEELKITADKYESYIQDGCTWAVRCKIDVTSLLTRQEVEQEMGEQLHKHFADKGISAKVKLSNPDTLFLAVLVGKDVFLGVDYAGVDLTKREYKIFSGGGNSLSGGTAAALLHIAAVKETDTVLIPFSRDGTIGIELAMQRTGTPPLLYKKDALQCLRSPFLTKDQTKGTLEDVDKKKTAEVAAKVYAFGPLLRDLKTGKKNAKIAGVEKAMEFSKVSVDWLDTKFDKYQLDKIVCMPPNTSFGFDEKKLKKAYEELFFQGEYILKKEGTLTTIGGKQDALLEAAQKNHFHKQGEHVIYQGKMPLTVLTFVKQAPKSI